MTNSYRLGCGLCVALATVLVLWPQSAGASRLFISTSPTSPVLENPTIHIRTGDSITLYLWWQRTDDFRVIAPAHDIVLSNPILSRPFPAPTPPPDSPPPDPTYPIDNPVIGTQPRWTEANSGVDFTPTLIVNDSNPVKVGGSDMGFGTTLDPTYHQATGTYRFSSLILDADSPGLSEVRIGIGKQGFAFQVNDPQDIRSVNFGFGDDPLAGNDPRRNTSTALTTLADATIYVAAAAKPWQNPALAFDVNANGEIAPQDALIIINELNAVGSHNLAVPPPVGGGPPNYLDPDGENDVDPADALTIINFLNAQSGSSASAAAFVAAAVPEPSGILIAASALAGLLVAGARCRRAKR